MAWLPVFVVQQPVGTHTACLKATLQAACSAPHTKEPAGRKTSKIRWCQPQLVPTACATSTYYTECCQQCSSQLTQPADKATCRAATLTDSDVSTYYTALLTFASWVFSTNAVWLHFQITDPHDASVTRQFIVQPAHLSRRQASHTLKAIQRRCRRTAAGSGLKAGVMAAGRPQHSRSFRGCTARNSSAAFQPSINVMG